MPTYNEDILPSSTGSRIGSTVQRWTAYLQDVDIAGNQTSAGNLTVTGSETVGGGLTVTGNTGIGGTLAVTGTATLSGALNVTGNELVGGNLGVTGATTLSSTLGVTGNATVGGTLGTTGLATFTNGLITNSIIPIGVGTLLIQGGAGATGSPVIISGGNSSANAGNSVSIFGGNATAGNNNGGSVLLTVGTPNGSGVKGTLLTTGKFTQYNGLNVAGNGVPSELGAFDAVAQGAAIVTNAIVNVPSGGAGQYRISWNMKITQAATTSSVLGAVTISYTDPDSVVITITAAAQIAAGTIATTSTGNTTGTVLIGLPMLLNCKASTNITYAVAYTSVGGTPMQYNFHIVCEAL